MTVSTLSGNLDSDYRVISEDIAFSAIALPFFGLHEDEVGNFQSDSSQVFRGCLSQRHFHMRRTTYPPKQYR